MYKTNPQKNCKFTFSTFYSSKYSVSCHRGFQKCCREQKEANGQLTGLERTKGHNLAHYANEESETVLENNFITRNSTNNYQCNTPVIVRRVIRLTVLAETNLAGGV